MKPIDTSADLEALSLDELRELLRQTQDLSSPWAKRFAEVEAAVRKKASEAAFEHVAKRRRR